MKEMVKQLKFKALAFAILRGRQNAKSRQIAEEKQQLEKDMQLSASKVAEMKTLKEEKEKESQELREREQELKESLAKAQAEK